MTAGSVHVAGDPAGLEQRCARCGIVLVDYANLDQVVEGRITEARPFFFPVAGAVQDVGAGMVVVAHRTVDPVAIRAAFCRLAPAGTPGVSA